MTAPDALDAEQQGWIELKAGGPVAIGAIRRRPWSVVAAVKVDGDDLWFKENIAALGYEVELHELLARHRPLLVPELAASDAGAGRLLLRDAGEMLREQPPSLDDWLSLLPQYAELQLAVAGDLGGLERTGTPARRLATLPRLFRELLADEASVLDSDERQAFERWVAELDGACEQLPACGVPETIDHGDFHDGNVFVRDGSFRFADWGDACISHPFGSLRIPIDILGAETTWPLDRVRDAYLEPFARFSPLDELRAAFDAGLRVGGATRALKWAAFARHFETPNEFEGTPLAALRALIRSGSR